MWRLFHHMRFAFFYFANYSEPTLNIERRRAIGFRLHLSLVSYDAKLQPPQGLSRAWLQLLPRPSQDFKAWGNQARAYIARA